ncbi:hypothetical protein [Streptomyces mutabilis]|uniref:Uncharacterized protein n=1 Tax=Streptomyces mutabilis TaxID=67332 RepID=A0A086MRH4_9ACTN|nr:hypothetical protein [Streptomyces mutabilis]KFG71492.1 hypothetical protein FM21_35140 [Streptomyces mutabilis]
MTTTPTPEPTETADRAAVLREEAARIRAHCPDHLDAESAHGAWLVCHCDVADDMERRMAAEAQPAAPDTEDPARIDRLRPEFTDHASVKAIDAQLDRARRQERRWHLRSEWLIGLRQRRVEQEARGEQPAVSGAAAAPAQDTPRSLKDRLLDAVTHTGPGYDLTPAAEQPIAPAKEA